MVDNICTTHVTYDPNISIAKLLLEWVLTLLFIIIIFNVYRIELRLEMELLDDKHHEDLGIFKWS
jgi:hypothetical protein